MTIGFTASAEDWENAYSNRRAIADFTSWLAEAAQLGAAYGARLHAAGRARLQLPYGAGPRRDFDLLLPDGPAQDAAQGTLIFIHGGYWQGGTKEEHHHFAHGALAKGWQVALPEYPLCPQASIAEISALMVQAVEAIAEACPQGPLVLAGHSAGGQLASYVVSAQSGLSRQTRARIGHVVSLSGLHDLRPLRRTAVLNIALQLTVFEADRFSPALLCPGHDFRLACICGGEELPEFIRQNALLANVWRGFGLATLAEDCAGRNHLTLLEEMSDPDSRLTALLTAKF